MANEYSPLYQSVLSEDDIAWVASYLEEKYGIKLIIPDDPVEIEGYVKVLESTQNGLP